MTFQLHSRLAQNCVELGGYQLCRLLLMNDSRYRWLILVPQKPEISEIYQLSTADQNRLIQESSLLSRQLAECFDADKMNIAALGNVVPQLHIHHIVRYRNDPAWPQPIWGQGETKPYTEYELGEVIARLKSHLTDLHWADV